MRKALRSMFPLVALALSLFELTMFAGSSQQAYAASAKSSQHTNPDISLTRILGGVDLNGYCKSIGYVRASLDGTTVYNWHCRNANNNAFGISMNSACRWEYPAARPLATARPLNFYNAYSWQCFSARQFGWANLD